MSTSAAPTVETIAALIDHAILKPETTAETLAAELAIAARWRVFSVCVRPSDIAESVATLARTGVLTGTVIGFPHGTTSTAAKVAESRQAIDDGAAELDMVLRIGALRSGRTDLVEADIAAVVAAAGDTLVKVILETVFLTDEQIVAGARAAERAGAAFVKTSTGFAGGGATLHDLALMRDAVGPGMRIKASGGVRGLDTLLAMRAAGVDRFGTSATQTILTDVERLVATGAVAGTVDASSY
ncbi:deoxyribose-phosphate aldolase [uncultured Amnibacterium sp.]|uniref:deoxyribose-phosphate aldolase n=1 Tax=uncultured Amnibacterium sp. TaxID=1631851 RepID=UPI0035CBD40B